MPAQTLQHQLLPLLSHSVWPAILCSWNSICKCCAHVISCSGWTEQLLCHSCGRLRSWKDAKALLHVNDLLILLEDSPAVSTQACSVTAVLCKDIRPSVHTNGGMPAPALTLCMILLAQPAGGCPCQCRNEACTNLAFCIKS